MTPRLIHADGWDLGQGWLLTLSHGAVDISYQHHMCWEWEGDPEQLRKAIAKALMRPIDPVTLGGAVEVASNEMSITIQFPSLSLEMENEAARGLVEVLREVCHQHSKEIRS